MNTTNISNWEIWLADVPYDECLPDGTERTVSKKRPVLVLDGASLQIIAAPITTHPPRMNFFGEYQISDYTGAGLDRPSVIRFSQITALSRGRFCRCLGVLSEDDIILVLPILSAIGIVVM